MNVRIVIFEPPGMQFGPLRRGFREEAPDGWEVHLVSSTEELISSIADPVRRYLAIVPDVLGDEDADRQARSGLELIPRLRNVDEDIAVVVVAEHGNVELASRVVAAGAADLLVLGEKLRQRIATLLGKLRKLFEVIDRKRLLDEHNAQLREVIQARLRIVGRSPQVQSLLEKIHRVATVPRPVLIIGERGTGKELVARAIHFASGASKRPIVTVNCAAFSDTLLESELFGHERGAFTGADATQYGKFEQADGGTLFLDEIGHMSLPFQEKILRVVEYGTFSRVGGTTELKTDARIIAATNRDLRAQIRQGEFLADLYDRLAFETIEVPPLRERNGDLEVLAQHFLDQFARETPAFGGKTLSRSALDVLRAYSFPGNVRELKNLVERAAYRDTTDEITPEDLGLLPQDDPAHYRGSFNEKLHGFAARLIHDALRSCEGNQAQAARNLGLSYHQFRYYLKKYKCGRE
ncbi:MAG: sigma-54-dependent Fis family transcriptional regulator [Pirellulales bacterium]|nr:sigma-54-dependent Fis family transcriptional regulator [Pirellulales bacterium]